MSRRRIAELLADPKTRAWLHAFALLAGATLVLALAGEQSLLGPGRARVAEDKLLHYEAGRMGALATFFVAYASTIARILIVGKTRTSSMTVALLWTPALIGLALFLACGVGALLGAGKEVLDAGGAGTPDMADFDATLAGALTVGPPVAIVMALTPFLIPMDVLLQIPRLMLTDVRSGFAEVDKYVRARRRHDVEGKGADALILEDDLTCAALALDFCDDLGLSAHHVTTVSEAEDYLRGSESLRLLMLDNFVRVDSAGDNSTGFDWLERLARQHPKGRRSFLVVMVSGHPHLLEGVEDLADLVLPKPWNLSELAAFLESNLRKPTPIS